MQLCFNVYFKVQCISWVLNNVWLLIISLNVSFRVSAYYETNHKPPANTNPTPTVNAASFFTLAHSTFFFSSSSLRRLFSVSSTHRNALSLGYGAENALQMAAKFLLADTCVAGAQFSGFARFSLNMLAPKWLRKITEFNSLPNVQTATTRPLTVLVKHEHENYYANQTLPPSREAKVIAINQP